MSTTNCGNCGWWADSSHKHPGAFTGVGVCMAPLPDSIWSQDKRFMRDIEGADCPCHKSNNTDEAMDKHGGNDG